MRGFVIQRAVVLLIAGEEISHLVAIGIIAQRDADLRLNGLQGFDVLGLVAEIDDLEQFRRPADRWLFVGRCRFCKPALNFGRLHRVGEKRLPPHVV